MSQYSYILVCEENKTYTHLHEYNRTTKQFKGEHSIIHNRHLEDARLLSSFLYQNREGTFRLVMSQDKEYSHIIGHFKRHLEEDIEKYMDEILHKEQDSQKDIQMDRNIGQLQLAIVKKGIEEEHKSVKTTRGIDSDDHQFLLGKEMGLKWVLEYIQTILNRPN